MAKESYKKSIMERFANEPFFKIAPKKSFKDKNGKQRDCKSFLIPRGEDPIRFIGSMVYEYSTFYFYDLIGPPKGEKGQFRVICFRD